MSSPGDNANSSTAARMRLFAVLTFAACIPGIVTWLYFVAFPGATATAILYGANKVMYILLPLLWIRLAVGRKPSFPRLGGRRALVAGILSGLAMMGATLSLYFCFLRHHSCLEGIPETVSAKLGDIAGGSMARFIVFASFLILLNSAMEEYYWRWFVFGGLKTVCPLWLAVVVASFTFMLHHVVVLSAYVQPEYFWGVAFFFSVVVAAGGAIWAMLLHRTGSFGAAWVSHLLADIGVMIVGLDLLMPCWD